MSEPRDLPSIVEAAERAAAAGDYTSAERHLRAAIAQQEATLGPRHPDLANTLNNLGVVSERAGHTIEAEDSYRQAYSVARAALDPEHPFVVTSARNLREFCEAFGRPFELPTAPPSAPSRGQPPSRPFPVRTLAVLGVAGLALIWLTARGPLRTPPATGPGAVTAPSTATVPATVTTPAGKPIEAPVSPTIPQPGNLSSRATHGRTFAAATPVSVARAQVCRALSTLASSGPDWPCDPVRGSASAGTLFFYTRLAAPKPTVVLHRWYRGDSLQQEVELSVNANPGPGYRTYSRLTIGPERAGDWRVELRTTDGILLQKESFVVHQ